MYNISVTSLINSILKELEQYKISLFISKELSIFLDDAYKQDVIHNNSIILNFNDKEVKVFIKLILENSSKYGTFDFYKLKLEWLAIKLAMVKVFKSISLKAVCEYLFKTNKEMLNFPTLEWTVEKNNDVILTSTPLIYLGGDFVFSNPSRFVPYRKTPTNELLLEESSSNNWLYNNLGSFKTPHIFTVFSEQNRNIGEYILYGKLITQEQRLSSFYSTSDRVFKVPIFKRATAFKDILFEQFNPCIKKEYSLKTKMFLFNKQGIPKVSFLGTINE